MALTDPDFDFETKIKLLKPIIEYEVPELTENSITAPEKVVSNHRKYQSWESHHSRKLADDHSPWYRGRGSRVVGEMKRIGLLS